MLVAVAVMLVVLAGAGPALAAAHGGGAAGGGGGFSAPFGLFGISISGILTSIAKLLFKAIASAMLPSFLRNPGLDALRWLIALPNPADAVQWPTMHRLERDTTAVAVAILPVTFAVAAARYTASGVTGGAHHPAESLGRLLSGALGLLLFPWAFENAIAFVNVITTALLSFSSIDDGLNRALLLMFAGGLAFGVTGPLIALILIGAILLAAGLFIIKVGVLAAFAVLFVAGPLAIAVTPIPELHGVWRLWLGIVIALALIPVGWCLIFAVAGAISADITHISTPAAIGTRLVGFFAGVLTFFLAFRWPFFLIGLVRARGLLSTETLGAGARAGAGGATAGGAAIAQRVAQARAALSAGVGTLGSAVSHAGTAFGAPLTGFAAPLARAAGRAGGWGVSRAADKLGVAPLAARGRETLDAGWKNLRARASESRIANSDRGRRAGAAAAVLAAGPAAVRAAGREVLHGHADEQGGRQTGDRILKRTVQRAVLRARERGYAARTRNAPDPNTRPQPQPPPSPNGHASDARGGVDAAAAAAAAAAGAHRRAPAGPPPRNPQTPGQGAGPADGAPRPAGAGSGPLESPRRQTPPRPPSSDAGQGRRERASRPNPPPNPNPNRNPNRESGPGPRKDST
ncbi:MAG: hypothetical protein ABSG43_10535 [Solirubrobacteraceae bacterium]